MTKEQLRNSIRIIVSCDRYNKLTDRLSDEIKGMGKLSKLNLRSLHREVYRKVMEDETVTSWHYEDALPDGYPYDEMFASSKVVDGVRMFPPVESHAIDKPRDFGLMTAQELAEYSGMVYMARCRFASNLSGKTIPCDYECPTPEMRTERVNQGRRLIGQLLSQTNYDYPRQQNGRVWAKAFGGINGQCGTNPEDVPDKMMTAKTFWRDHANRSGS